MNLLTATGSVRRLISHSKNLVEVVPVGLSLPLSTYAVLGIMYGSNLMDCYVAVVLTTSAFDTSDFVKKITKSGVVLSGDCAKCGEVTLRRFRVAVGL